MMKKVGYYILMIATLLLGACSEGKDEPAIVQPTDKGKQVVQQEEPIPAEGDPIVFTASINDGEADTRAITYNNTYDNGTNIVYGGLKTPIEFHDGIEDNSDLQKFGFGVYGYYTIDKKIGVDDFVGDIEHPVDPSYKTIIMLNQKVTWNENKWTYTPTHYWPGSERYMSFFAYAPWSATNHPDIGTEHTDYEKTTDIPYYHFINNIKIPIKKTPWLFEDQEDLIWGMNGATGLPYKNIRRPDTKTASTPEGTLGWEFKHAFARVKFSIFNLKDLYENPSMNIAVGTDVINKAQGDHNDGKVGYRGTGSPQTTSEVKTYTPDPEKPNKKEYYIQLNETGNSLLCHKFEDIGDNSAILIITGVTFKNVVKSANFSYDNTTAFEPGWTINEVYGENGYNIPPTLLNQSIYMDDDYLSSLPSNTDYSDLRGLRTSMAPLTKASDPDKVNDPDSEMDGKIHYFLFIPTQEYMNFVDNNQAYLVVTIKYKIVRGYKLTGYYTWTNDGPEPSLDSGDFTMIGIQGQDVEQTSTIEVPVSFVANKSYHVAMRFGKMLQVLFEVTDWDVPQSITVNIPSFE